MHADARCLALVSSSPQTQAMLSRRPGAAERRGGVSRRLRWEVPQVAENTSHLARAWPSRPVFRLADAGLRVLLERIRKLSTAA